MPEELQEKIPVYPIDDEEDYLHRFNESNIAECVSTLGVHVIITQGNFRMGDSSVVFKVKNTIIKGEEGKRLMNRFAEDFVSIAKEALSEMSSDYRAFYEYMINDYENNGLIL